MRLVAFSVLLLMISTRVLAVPVAWTLDGVKFDDGNTLEGGFTYDADTDTYSDVYMYASDLPFIGYSDGQLGGWVIYNDFWGTSTAFNAETWYDLYPAFRLNIELNSALTNTGGLISIASTSYEDAWTYDPDAPIFQRFIVAGNVSAVPIPAAVWLFASGLGLLGWFRRKGAAA